MIRPIEMQMLLPRTESVGSEKHFENRQIVNENHFAANEVQKEVQHNSETVIKKDANQIAEYQYDAKEEGNGTYQDSRRKRRQKNAKDEEENKNDRETDEVNEKFSPRINIQI